MVGTTIGPGPHPNISAGPVTLLSYPQPVAGVAPTLAPSPGPLPTLLPSPGPCPHWHRRALLLFLGEKPRFEEKNFLTLHCRPHHRRRHVLQRRRFLLHLVTI